jgi:hypothetical protein
MCLDVTETSVALDVSPVMTSKNRNTNALTTLVVDRLSAKMGNVASVTNHSGDEKAVRQS